jgi:hypothetical protein
MGLYPAACMLVIGFVSLTLNWVGTLSRSRVRDGGGGAVEVEVTDEGKEPGIPADMDVDMDSVSGMTQVGSSNL